MGRGNRNKKINPYVRKKKTDNAESENALAIERLDRKLRNLKLPNLKDVDSDLNPEDGQIIIYDQASQKWIAADAPSGGGSGTGGEDKHYIHNQTTASTVWVIDHDLEKRPAVAVVSSTGSFQEGAVVYTTINSLSITFNASFSGKAYLN